MNKLKIKIQEIIFEADTPMGKLFDIALLVMILLSVIVVMLESVLMSVIKKNTIFGP